MRYLIAGMLAAGLAGPLGAEGVPLVTLPGGGVAAAAMPVQPADEDAGGPQGARAGENTGENTAAVPPMIAAVPVPTLDLTRAAAPRVRPPSRGAVQPVAAAISTSRLPRPPTRFASLPRTRWQHMAGHALWTQTALSALKSHGKPLTDLVPADVEDWCPAYPQADAAGRRAFWVGFLSALAKHESTYKPWAVGGGGLWYGLLQILPGTARGYRCNVGTGEALKSGAANLSCAVRIMAVTVPRDGVIYGRGGKGVAADWGPMRSAAKRRDMAGWLKRQSYCKPLDATRPRSRP